MREVGRIVSKVNITALIDEYENLVFSICYKLTNDYFAAQDLTQETFLSAYRSWGQFDGVHEKAWICRIATNKCMDYLKSAARRIVPMQDEELETVSEIEKDPEEHFLEQEIRQELLSRCGQLKPPYDKVARFYFYEEKKPDEIAKETGQNLKTVQTQIYRARDMLRKLYKGGMGHAK